MKAILLAALLAFAPVVALAQGITSYFPGPGTPASGGAPASTVQVIASNTNGIAVSTAAERFYAFGTSGPASVAVLADSGTVSAPGTFGNFRCWVGTAVSGAQNWICKLYKNGSATSVTCTISTSSLTTQSCIDSTHTSSVVANDVLSWSATAGSAPTSDVMSAAAEFTPTTANDTLILGGNHQSNWDTTNTTMVPGFGERPSGSESAVTAYFPEAGTIDKFYVRATTALSGAGVKRTLTVRVNTADTTVTCPILSVADGGDGKTCNDTTHSASVTAGQPVALKQAPTNTPTGTAAGFGFRFVPTTSGNFVFQLNTIAASESASATNFLLINGQQNPDATEKNVQSVVGAMTVVSMRANNVNAPGAAASGKKRVYTLRSNGVDTAATCQIFETATSCSWSGTVSVSANDVLSVSTVPTGTPTGTGGTAVGIGAHQ